MKPLKFLRDADGLPINAIEQSDTIHTGELAAATATALTVPTGAYYALFSATGDFWIDYTGTSAEISGAFSATGMEINPTLRKVQPGQALSLYSTAGCKVSVAFFGR